MQNTTYQTCQYVMIAEKQYRCDGLANQASALALALALAPRVLVAVV